MGRRDRDERDAGSSPVVTPDYTSTPTQNSSAPTVRDPVRTSTPTNTGHNGPATMPTVKTQPGNGGVKTGNPDAGPATSISSNYGDSHSGSIGTGKVTRAPDPVTGTDYRPGLDGPSWSEAATDNTRPDAADPGYFGYGTPGEPNPIGYEPTGFDQYYDPRDGGTTRGHTTTTMDPTRVSTGRPRQGTTTVSTGTPVQTTKDAPDKDRNTCKPRPKDNRPKGGGGGGKQKRFVPWCS